MKELIDRLHKAGTNGNSNYIIVSPELALKIKEENKKKNGRKRNKSR